MTISTRTLAEMQAEMSSDEATGWVKVSHWTQKLSNGNTKHIILKNRTVIREYIVDWSSGTPVVTDTPAEYSTVGDTVTSAELKIAECKRHKGTTMYNEVTREIATL
jgi:hypothetical protein